MSKLNDYDCLIAETWPFKSYYGYAKNLGLDCRIPELAEQFEKEGFDYTEIWNLDTTIIRFALPRLKHYKNNIHGYPNNLTSEAWLEILDKMICGFDLLLSDDFISWDSPKQENINEAFELFHEYFRDLWN